MPLHNLTSCLPQHYHYHFPLLLLLLLVQKHQPNLIPALPFPGSCTGSPDQQCCQKAENYHYQQQLQ
jgi:hypothetical protein